MTFAYLLPPEKHYEPNGHLLIAGAVALIVAFVRWRYGSKKQPPGRSYGLWLFFGAGLCLVILSLLFGSYVEPSGVLGALL